MVATSLHQTQASQTLVSHSSLGLTQVNPTLGSHSSHGQVSRSFHGLDSLNSHGLGSHSSQVGLTHTVLETQVAPTRGQTLGSHGSHSSKLPLMASHSSKP